MDSDGWGISRLHDVTEALGLYLGGMRCLHCSALNALAAPFDQPIEGGKAYGRRCTMCGRLLGLRPRSHTDPEVLFEFTREEWARLSFLKWLHTRSVAGADQLDPEATTVEHVPQSAS